MRFSSGLNIIAISQLRQRLDDLIRSQFWDTPKVHKTSGLLGFYGSQIKHTSERDRFGLDSILAEAVRGTGIQEETPQFVNEFNRYCGLGKFVGSEFKPSVRGYETPAENYVRILSEWGLPLIEKLIQDSDAKECEILRLGYQRWQKGKLLVEVDLNYSAVSDEPNNQPQWEIQEINFYFKPDEPEIPQPESPLDDLRQRINQENQPENQ